MDHITPSAETQALDAESFAEIERLHGARLKAKSDAARKGLPMPKFAPVEYPPCDNNKQRGPSL